MAAMGAPEEFMEANAMVDATALCQHSSAVLCRLVGESNDNYPRCAGRARTIRFDNPNFQRSFLPRTINREIFQAALSKNSYVNKCKAPY